MHAPTFPIDRDYAAAWDEACKIRMEAKIDGLDLDMSNFAYNNETGQVMIDGMLAREWLEAMLMD